MDDVDHFLEQEAHKHRTYDRALQRAWWDAETLGTDEAFAASERAQNALADAYADPAVYAQVLRYLDRPGLDPERYRQLSILRLRYLAEQGDQQLRRRIIAAETALTQKFNTYRATIDGRVCTDNEIDAIMTTSRDSDELRKAWEASKLQGRLVVDDVLAVVRLRNERARAAGFADHYAFSLFLQEQTPEGIAAVFDDLHAQTAALSTAMLSDINARLARRYGIPEDEIRPWHYQDLYFQEAPKVYEVDLDKHYTEGTVRIAREFYAAIGLPVDDILRNSSLYEQEGKSQHAFCVDMDREGDVRVLCNMRDNERWMNTLLHECGHGVYWKHMDGANPYLLRTDAHTLVTEAVAIMFEKLSSDPSFLRAYAPGGQDEDLARRLREHRRAEFLAFANWSQVMVRFERALYEDSERDLNGLWWSLVRKYQGVEFSRDEPDWAAKIHLATVPVYYHNYQLGHLLASQLVNAMRQEGIADMVGDPGAGAFLKRRLFDLGARYRWDETILRATGERLNAAHWAREIA